MKIYDYIDYRKFLNDHFDDQRKKHDYFSFRYFARIAKLGSESYLCQIMQGKRDLGIKSLRKVSKALGFKAKEAAYFENLVLYNQAKKENDRDIYFNELVKNKPTARFHKLEKDSFEYVTNKFNIIIRELVALPFFKEDYAWMARCLGNKIRELDIKKAIQLLLRLNLIKRNENGMLKQSRGTVKSPIDANSLEIFKYHRSVLAEAKDVILKVPYQLRELSSQTIPVSIKSLPKIKRIIQKCQEDIAECANQYSDEFDDVFQINIQLFPVTKARKIEKP